MGSGGVDVSQNVSVSPPHDVSAPPAAGADPFAPELIPDPYPAYARLLAGEPFFHAPTRFWVVSRYDDVRQVVHEPRFSRADFRERARSSLGDGPLSRALGQFLLFRDPPDHTRLRSLVGQAFTRRAVDGLRQQIQATVDDLLDRVQGVQARGSLDLIAGLAYPLPVLVICALLGVPAAERARFRAWSAALAEGLEAASNPNPEAIARGDAAAEEVTAFFREQVAERRAEPREDLLSGLVAARDGADRLGEEELLATCLLLFIAGHETTVNLIGNGTLALLRNPDQLAQLRAEPALIGTAVEELLRFDSPVQRTFRVAEQEVELGGARIARGERVMALLGAANRDPRRFVDPDRLDLRRRDASQHLSFGGGIHYCVGAPLARLEAQLALGTLLRRLPDLRLLEETPAWRPALVFRGLRRLELGFTAAP
jgi:cytochrome P450